MVARGLSGASGPGQPSLSIALCTCNGERYIEPLLASLARQTVLPNELVIGDDASDDTTLSILQRFARSAPFPVRIAARRERLGHAPNFLATARDCAGEWIAFADQDDVWFDSKLAEAQAVIAADRDLLLVNQRALLCDEELKPRTNALFPADSHPGRHDSPHRPLPLVWPGFLMTVKARLLHDFDPDLRPWLPADGAKIGHGRWSFLLAAALGSYFVTDAPSAWYRRHPAALTGDYRPIKAATDFRTRNLATLQDHSDYAEAAAECLARLADLAVEPTDSLRFEAAAQDYSRAAQALGRRAGIYTAPTLPERLGAMLAANRQGAYFGPSLYAGGARAAAKDAAAALGL